jgi:transcriptional regulator with PAS, ATPase and Fis domain
MQSYQKEITQIEQILKDNPKGMTVTDIARKIKTNRNSVAKYLDIMRISGLVEMITFGPAKVFFPSRRIPISKMLNFTSDYVMVFDKDLKIVLINDTFLGLMRLDEGEIIGQYLDNIRLPILNKNLDLYSDVKEAFEGKEFTRDVVLEIDGEDVHCVVRIIPTVFEDGQHAVALVMKDVTTQKIVKEALRMREKKSKKRVFKK